MIPAFNEEASIASVIKSIPRKIAGISKVEVLVINDGSTDKTVEAAKKAGANKIASHLKNKGLGITFKEGIEAALQMKAGIIVNIDGDGQFDTKDIPKIIKPILDGKADVVTCTRFGVKELEPEMPAVKRFGNEIFTKTMSFLTGKKFTDTQCGFRAYSQEAALSMSLFGKYTYVQEVLLNLISKGFEVVEVPCKVKGERKGKSRLVKHWWDYGLRALLIIVRTLRDYNPLKFFGVLGVGMFLLGALSAFALWVRLLLKHAIDPFLWVVYADVILIILGFLLIILALLADMNDRQRKIQEEILYRIKKKGF